MIVWLSSYPRSGNTLLRQMFWSVWGWPTYSVYGDAIGTCDRRIPEMIGHKSFGCSFDQAYAPLTQSDDLHLVKTHEIPIDSQKAIYIARDGRSATRSLYHYRREFDGCAEDVSNLRDILLGSTPWGSWSSHLKNWDPLNRPGTLLVKYEDLVHASAGQIERIAEFLNAEPRRPWKNGFAQLSQIEPRLFRAATANLPEQALSGPELELFWELHEPWMRRLGYATKSPLVEDSYQSHTGELRAHAAL